MLTEQLIWALYDVMLKGVDKETARDIKRRIKEPLIDYIEDNRVALRKAEEQQELCLMNDDGFSRETEAVMAEVDYLSVIVDRAEKLLKLLPKDVYVPYMSTSGVHYDVL